MMHIVEYGMGVSRSVGMCVVSGVCMYVLCSMESPVVMGGVELGCVGHGLVEKGQHSQSFHSWAMKGQDCLSLAQMMPVGVIWGSAHCQQRGKLYKCLRQTLKVEHVSFQLHGYVIQCET